MDIDLPQTNKSLGQHWLTDLSALNSIVDAAGIGPEDTVLEIGPGPGALTKQLVKKAKQVIAVEFDARLANALLSQNISPNIKVVQQDILRFDLTSLPADYKVVANIPYYLTSKLIRNLSETPNPAERIVLLIQKEVAERVCAEPGDMSLLSVSAQYYWQTSLGVDVPAKMFTPPPKVDSKVIILSRWEKPLFENTDTKEFFHLVKAGFSARRKTLLNSLSGGLRKPKEEVQAQLTAAGLDPGLRAQALSLGDWHKLYLQNQK